DCPLVQQPRESELRLWHAALAGDLRDAVDDAEVDLGRVEGIAEWVGPRAGRQALAFARASTGQQPSRERAPRQYADALVDALRDHLALLLAVDEVVVVLHRDEGRLGHI